MRKSFQAVRHVRVALTLVLDVTFLYQLLLYVWRIFLKIGFLEVEYGLELEIECLQPGIVIVYQIVQKERAEVRCAY